MNYTVDWNPSAEQELTDLWLNAADRNTVTDAANRMERALERDPWRWANHGWEPPAS